MCDALTKKGKPCKRRGFCWQHWLLRGRRKPDSNSQSIWLKLGADFRVQASLTLVITVLGIGTSRILDRSHAQPAAAPLVAASPQPSASLTPSGSTCPTPDPSKSPPKDSSVAYSISLQDTIPTMDGLEANPTLPIPQVGSQFLASTIQPIADQQMLKAVDFIAQSQPQSSQPLIAAAFLQPSTIATGAVPEKLDPELIASILASSHVKSIPDLTLSGVGNGQVAIGQTTDLTLTAGNAGLTRVPIPSSLESLSNSSIVGNGAVPLEVPTGLQPRASISGTAFPTTLPTNLVATPQ